MKKSFYILALFISFLSTAQQQAGPQKIIDVPVANGTPDFFVRGTDLLTRKMTWANVFSAFSTSLSGAYYPYSSNPANYLTQQTVLEYADLASLPITGTAGVIYVANNNATTGVPVYYIWNGSSYVTTAQPFTGITGSGAINRLPKFNTPTSVINSNFSDNGTSGRYFNPLNISQYVEFLNSATAFLRIDRGQSRMDFFLGNAGSGVLSGIYSTQATEGLMIASDGDLLLKAGSALVGSGGDNSIQRVYINRTTGNVGIGTGTTASDRLHVSGDFRLTGAFKDSSNSAGTSGQVLSSNGTGTSWVSGPSGTYLPLSGGIMSGDLQVQTIPASSNSAVSWAHLQNLLTGLTWKNAVKCSTTANHSLSGTANIDGVTIPAGTRVLVRFQTLTEQNGIYVTAAGSWTRALDCDTAAEIETSTVLVTSGTLYKNTQWTESLSITTVGTDPVNYAQLSGAGTYSAGSGISLTANVFSVASAAITNSMLANSAITVQGTSVSLGGSVNPINGTGYPKASGTSISYNATIPNADLTNSAITVQGTSVSLGGSVNPINGTGYPKAAGTAITYNTTIPNADLTNSAITVQGISVSLGGSVNPINGTGAVRAAGTSISYDNATYVKNVVKDAVTTTGVNSTITETILASYLIPANTFASSDVLNLVNAKFKSNGSGGTIIYRIYINTSNSLTGAVVISSISQSNASMVSSTIGPKTYTFSGGNLEGLFSTSSDVASNSFNALNSTALNPAANFYIITTAQLGTSNLNNARQTLLYITN